MRASYIHLCDPSHNVLPSPIMYFFVCSHFVRVPKVPTKGFGPILMKPFLLLLLKPDLVSCIVLIVDLAATIAEMISVIESRLPEIDFPFLVLHDPNGEPSFIVMSDVSHNRKCILYVRMYKCNTAGM